MRIDDSFPFSFREDAGQLLPGPQEQRVGGVVTRQIHRRRDLPVGHLSVAALLRPVPLIGYRVEDGTDFGDFAEIVIVGRDVGRMDAS